MAGTRSGTMRELGYARAIEPLGYRIGLDKATSAMLVDYFVGQREAATSAAAGEPDVNELIDPAFNLLPDGDVTQPALLILVDDTRGGRRDRRLASPPCSSIAGAIREDPALRPRYESGSNPIDETITTRPLRRDAMVRWLAFARQGQAPVQCKCWRHRRKGAAFQLNAGANGAPMSRRHRRRTAIVDPRSCSPHVPCTKGQMRRT